MSGAPPDRPRVVLLRGHHANVWDLAPWAALNATFDVSVLVTGSNVHQTDGVAIPAIPVRTPRDVMPAGRAAGALAYLTGERYLDLERHLAGAAIVHGAEIGTWHSAQAAKLKRKLGFQLVLTVWETIAWRDTYRWPRERG
ncbi:MAG: glycosyl transferase group 1, partial [Conexibacter sp.]|nr:glycosyl transferase group 1 [Conexibacter sp.]